MEYNKSKNAFKFTFPDHRVALRLRKELQGQIFYICFDGALRQCKVLSARIEPKEEFRSGWDFNQMVKVDIAGIGIREVRYTCGTIDRNLGKINYKCDTPFYASVENYKNRLYHNLFVQETEQEFAEQIFKDGLKWNYKPRTQWVCGSISPAERFKWDGTKVVDFDVEIPMPTFNTDGTISFGNKEDVVEGIRQNSYATAEECREKNEIKVVTFSPSVRYKWTAECDGDWYEDSDTTFDTIKDCYNDMRDAVLRKMKWNTELEDCEESIEDGADCIGYDVRFAPREIIHSSYSGVYTYRIIEV